MPLLKELRDSQRRGYKHFAPNGAEEPIECQ